MWTWHLLHWLWWNKCRPIWGSTSKLHISWLYTLTPYITNDFINIKLSHLYRILFSFNSCVIHTYSSGWGKILRSFIFCLVLCKSGCFLFSMPVDNNWAANSRASSQKLSLPARSAREHAPLHWDQVLQIYDSRVHTTEERNSFSFFHWFSLDIAVHIPAEFHCVQIRRHYFADSCICQLYCPLLIKL